MDGQLRAASNRPRFDQNLQCTAKKLICAEVRTWIYSEAIFSDHTFVATELRLYTDYTEQKYR
jgi:hypothetical protein